MTNMEPVKDTPAATTVSHVKDLLVQGELEKAYQLLLLAIKANDKAQPLWRLLSKIYMQMGEVSKAKRAAEVAIKLKPSDHEALFDLAGALIQQGDTDTATKVLEEALRLNPQFTEAHHNLGSIQASQGNYSRAYQSLNRALTLRDDFQPAREALMALLTVYTQKNEYNNSIVKADAEISQLAAENQRWPITPDNLATLVSQSDDILKCYDIKTIHTQILREAADLGCDRHMGVFNQRGIIPKFCFGCFKLQINVCDVLSLLKLYLIFDSAEFEKYGNRKCMIETRPEISGHYKGLIYCNSLEQANAVKDEVESILASEYDSHFDLYVKRGCSEYELRFPEFNMLPPSSSEIMEYPPEWKKIENEYDMDFPSTLRHKGVSALKYHLKDAAIISNWLSYARGLGDTSGDRICWNTDKGDHFFRVATTKAAAFAQQNKAGRCQLHEAN